MFGPYFFDGPVNQHAYLDMVQNCSCRNWKTLVLKTISAYKGMDYRHITHLLFGNTLVRISENVGLAVGHKWCLEAQTL
jgi:hypothetical protein